jgi:hypothetical protein
VFAGVVAVLVVAAGHGGGHDVAHEGFDVGDGDLVEASVAEGVADAVPVGAVGAPCAGAFREFDAGQVVGDGGDGRGGCPE